MAAENFARALHGEPCTVIGPGEQRVELPIADWKRDVDDDDRSFLRHCVGATIDVGCGPGRMTAALAERGQVALGVDVVSEAVQATRDRGGSALHLDLHQPLPGEGRWDTVLLADGNIGIGGDPAALLRRMRDLLASNGRIVTEVCGPGTVTRSVELRLACGRHRSERFSWSFVSADSIHDIATDAGLDLRSCHPHGQRWCALLEAR